MRAAGTSGQRRHVPPRLIGAVMIAAVVIGLDQLTKALALEHLAAGPRHLFGPFSLDLAFNSGGAFSLGSGFSGPIVIGAMLALIGVAWLVRSLRGPSAMIAFGLILGGALGNLSDRLFRGRGGSVVDFIHTGFWPTFNVADAAITCGCVLLVVVFWRSGPKDRASTRGAREDDSVHVR